MCSSDLALGIGGVVGTLANGVSIGAGSSQSATTTYSNERFVIIPPYGTLPLKKWESVETKREGLVSCAWRKWVSCGENFYMDTQKIFSHQNFLATWFDPIEEYSIPDIVFGSIRIGESRMYDYVNSPLKKDYSIRYYKGDNSNTYFTTRFSLYAKQIIGCTEANLYGDKYEDQLFDQNVDIIGFSRHIDYYGNL